MSDCNSTDGDRLSARIDAILTAAFPLAASPDFPIGPLPLFKIRNLLADAYSAGLADAEPGTADDDDTETSLYRLDAILNAIDAMARDRDYSFDQESVQRLISMARELVARLLPAGADEP